jgi:alpha-L-fucosidase
VTYDDFIPRFQAERFDPDSWIRLFRDAGAGYFVLTAKHHDGFALWCTDTTNRDACAMGPRRDLVGELFAAARRAGDVVRPGLYYSLPEWFNPAPRPPSGLWGSSRWSNLTSAAFPNGWRPRNAYTLRPQRYTGYQPIADYARGQAIPQTRELIDRYRPSVLWCDLGGSEQYYRYNEVIADYFNGAAARGEEVVVNDRCGDRTTHADFATHEYASATAKRVPPFEDTRGLGRSFGFNRYEPSSAYLSESELITTLVASVARGGNLLINIGPRADGTIPELMSDRLRALGRWLRINGDAIYASTRWVVAGEGRDVWFTRGRDGAVYALLGRWPGRTVTLRSPIPTGPGTEMTLLGGDGRRLRYSRDDGGAVTIEMPADTQAESTRSPHTVVVRIAPGR